MTQFMTFSHRHLFHPSYVLLFIEGQWTHQTMDQWRTAAQKVCVDCLELLGPFTLIIEEPTFKLGQQKAYQ